MTSDRQLRTTIAELKTLESKCFSSRQRFAFYDYLLAVHELYERLRRTNEAKTTARRIARLFGIGKQNGAHSMRIIIDATSGADDKTKSRWTRALRYAWHKRKRWNNFQSFMRQNGGPAGCADRFAEVHSKVTRGWQMPRGERAARIVANITP